PGRLQSEARRRPTPDAARGHLQPVRSADRAELRYVHVADIWRRPESELRLAHIPDPGRTADSGAEADSNRRALHVLSGRRSAILLHASSRDPQGPAARVDYRLAGEDTKRRAIS